MIHSKLDGAFVCALIAILVGWTEQAKGSVISDRTELRSLIGGTGTIENFESYNFNGDMTVLVPGPLDSNTSFSGIGPGLVIPGVVFSSSEGLLQWNNSGYYGSPSKELNGFGKTMAVNFLNPTRAFGIDIRAYSGYGDSVTLEIFSGDYTTLIDTISGISISGTGVPVFAGYEYAGGIGRIAMTASVWSWSPIIDNLEFGAMNNVPEPTSMAIFGLGALGFVYRARRKARS